MPDLVFFTQDPNHPQKWTDAEMAAINGQAWVYAGAYAATLNANARHINALSHETGITVDYISSWGAFKQVHGGPVNFIRSSKNSGWIGKTSSKGSITIFNTESGSTDYIVRNPNLVGHELGHAFQWAAGSQDIPTSLAVAGGDARNGYYGFRGGYDKWQFYSSLDDDEIFADMSIGWAHDSWWIGPESGGLAGARQGYMNSTMLYLLLLLVNR